MIPGSPDDAPSHGKVSIFVNGRARQVEARATLGEVATACGLAHRQLLVELDGETLPRESWPQHPVAHGARVEFVRVVAGG